MKREAWMRWLVLALLTLHAAPLAAQDAVVQAGPVPGTYALLIGSNPGGQGQTALHHAQDDARKMAALLTELGHFPAAHTKLLLDPDKGTLLGALRELRSVLQAHRDKGEQAQLVFYYSGHARANALHLGNDELLVSELRARLLELPTTLTVIVMDACQSGAFSQVKGAAPTAAFSYNSVVGLQTQGVAVMASSSGSELSQESDALGGSYFTHNLIVGLRGAGDSDRNGIVSLSEAYHYAYDRTLSATARTAVGEQHVTLETALVGQGDVALTYPAEARAQLVLSSELQGDVLIEHSGSVLAELHKVKGSALPLALPAGAYTAVLRQPRGLFECDLTLRDGHATPLLPTACDAISDDEARTKGYLAAAPDSARPHEEWGFELGFGVSGFKRDAYTKRLTDFGFAEQILAEGSFLRLQIAASRQLAEHLSVLVDFRNYDAGHYRRDLQSTPEQEVIERFDWSTFALGAGLRAHTDPFGDALRLYAQLGVGLGLAHSKLGSHAEDYAGPVLAGAAGMFYMPWRTFGFVFQATYAYAPILRNELDEVHDSGNLALAIGLRYRTWSQP